LLSFYCFARSCRFADIFDIGVSPFSPRCPPFFDGSIFLMIFRAVSPPFSGCFLSRLIAADLRQRRRLIFFAICAACRRFCFFASFFRLPFRFFHMLMQHRCLRRRFFADY